MGIADWALNPDAPKSKPKSKAAPKVKRPAKKSATVTNALEGITGKPSKKEEDAPKQPRTSSGKSTTVVDALAGIAGPAVREQAADRKAGTKAQRQRIRKQYDKLSPAQKKKALANAKVGTITGDTILSTHADRVRGLRKDRDKPIPPKTAKASAKVGVSGSAKVGTKKDGKGGGVSLGAVTGLATRVAAGGPEAAVTLANAATGSKIPLPSKVAKISLAATKNVAQATAESPGQVASASARETANILRGIGAAGLGAAGEIGKTASDPKHIEKLPGGIKKFAEDTAKSYSRRYGDVLSNPKAFRERVKHEGAVSYALDLAPGVASAGKLAGEAGGAAARAGALGKAAKDITEARPNLRVSGGTVKPQERSTNLYRAAAQEAKDKSRASAARKRAEKDPHGRQQGLIPKDGEVVRRTVRAQNRTQKKMVAKESARAGHRTRRDQHREVHGGKTSSAAVTKKLNKREQLGLKYAIQLGIRDPATAVRELTARRAAILKARANGKKIEADFDEIPVIDAILKDPESVFTPKLAEAAKLERERGKRVAAINPDLKPENAVARQHADQAAHLDITRGGTPIREAQRDAAKDLAKAKRKQADAQKSGDHARLSAAIDEVKAARKVADDLKAQKRKGVTLINEESLADLVARVQAKAKERGLDEPGYFPGRVYDEGGSAPYTGHNIGRAMGKDKQYHGTSFAYGIQDTSAEALQLGLAKNIKRAHNYRGVADNLERATPAWGKGKSGAGLTAAEAKQAIRENGGHPDSWALVDTKTIRREIEDADVKGDMAGTDARVAHALEHNIRDLDAALSEYGGTGQRFHVVPKAVADELKDSMMPTPAALRGIAKIQGVQTRLLLDTNPTFVPVQIVANTPLAILAMRGNVLDLVRGNRWYRSLDQAGRDVVDELVGGSVSRSHGATQRFGDSTGNRLARGWDALINNQRYRAWQESALNPMQINPLLDDAQNAFFRRAVFYNAAKRERGKSMARAARGIADEAGDVIRALEMPPGPARDVALRKAEPAFERIGERVNEMLGDFATFTAKERKYLKTTLLFYGFMRWATRLAFYTLPVKHPIATTMAGRLGQLHNEEVTDLLADYAESQGIGSSEQVAKLLREGALPYVYGRVWVMKDGHLEYADSTRLSPLMSPLVNAMERSASQGVAGPVSAATGLMSPAFSNLLDASYGKSTFTGKELKDKDGNPLKGGQTAAYVLGQQARTVWPIRVADKVLNPAPQSDESIPLVRVRNAPAKNADAKARNAQKLDERGSDANVLLDELLAMARTRRDGTLRGIAAELDKKRKADSKKNGPRVKKAGGLPSPSKLPSPAKLPTLPPLPKLPQ